MKPALLLLFSSILLVAQNTVPFVNTTIIPQGTNLVNPVVAVTPSNNYTAFGAIGVNTSSPRGQIISTIGFTEKINATQSLFLTAGLLSGPKTNGVANIAIVGIKQNLKISNIPFIHPFLMIGYGATIKNTLTYLQNNTNLLGSNPSLASLVSLTSNPNFTQNYGGGFTVTVKGFNVGLGVKTYKTSDQTINTPFFIIDLPIK